MKKTQQPYKILSVGGSIIIPSSGFNIPFLKQFRSLVLSEIKKGQRFILVVGGGTTCRLYQAAAAEVVKLRSDDLDWIGIQATIYNAHFVKQLFKGVVHNEIITDPRKKVKTNKPLIIAAGWKPGFSTDTDAVYLAKTYHAKHIFNLSNITHVYDKDPHRYADAKKIESIGWKQFRRQISGFKWSPGHSAPFDPIASRLAEKHKLTVHILRGTDIENVAAAVRGRETAGTVIHP